jgi:hypothetical protein
MKKILLIPTYHYLSNPVYKSLKEILADDDFEFIYFFNKDTCSIEANLNNISEDKVGKYFDIYTELKYDPIWVKKIKDKTTTTNKKEMEVSKNYFVKVFRKIIKIVKNLLHIYDSFQNYVNENIKMIQNINPDIVIITSDMSLSYRILKRYFPKIKVIILQPCFLDFREKKVSRKISFIGKIANILLRKTLYPKQLYFGLESENNKLLVFEEKFAEFYKDKRKQVYRIFNPFFTQMSEQIFDLNKNDIKEKLYTNKNIDKTKPIVILFIMDYTLSHGADVQEYTERAYISIIKRYINEFNFILKNHPRVGIKDFDIHFKENENVIFISEQITYEELLAVGDINISINSNASLESLICGMTTINFLPLKLSENEHFKWLSYYCGLEAITIEDLESLLEQYLIDKNSFIEIGEKGRKKLVGTKEECRESFLKVLNEK